MKSVRRKAIQSQKNNRAPGDDRITNELLKSIIDIIDKPLQILYNEILSKEQTPLQWTKSTIVLIHKKGDKEKIENYRPISLMTNLYKIFSKIILGRLTKGLDEQQPKEQAGFRSDFSTIDHIHVANQVMEKYNEYGKTYYIAFVDYNKAFDSLIHKHIYKALENQGVNRKYIRIIKQIYENSIAMVHRKKMKINFQLRKG